MLFPRLDIDKELEELAAIKAAQEPAGGKEADHPLELKPEITYEDFDKLDLRVGTIVEAERHPKARQAPGVQGKDWEARPGRS